MEFEWLYRIGNDRTERFFPEREEAFEKLLELVDMALKYHRPVTFVDKNSDEHEVTSRSHVKDEGYVRIVWKDESTQKLFIIKSLLWTTVTKDRNITKERTGDENV